MVMCLCDVIYRYRGKFGTTLNLITNEFPSIRDCDVHLFKSGPEMIAENRFV